MGLLDALFSPDSYSSGSGLLGALPSLQYANTAPMGDTMEEAKKKRDADFMASINQNPFDGASNLTSLQAAAGNWPSSAAPIAGQFGGVSPFGLGGPNIPAAQIPSQAAPASGPFPAVPMFAQPQPQPAGTPQGASPSQGAQMPVAAPQPIQGSPQQSGPINIMDIGGYKMPQFGTVADYTPQPGTPTDVSAQSRTAPPASPAFLQPQSSSGFGGAARGAMANMQNGPLGMIGGALAGAMGMGQGSERDQQRANQKAQYDALVDAGVPKQQAMIAILNPAAGKAIIDQYLGREKYSVVKTGENEVGKQVYRVFNPADGTFKDIPQAGADDGSAIPANAQMTSGTGLLDAMAQARDGGASREDLYKMAPDGLRETVQAMVEGRAIPHNLTARSDVRNRAVMLAHAIDPTFDEGKILERSKYRTELGSNSPNTAGGQIKAFVQGTGHLDSLASTLEKLDNSNGFGIPILAQGANAVRQGWSNKQSAIADEANGLSQTLAGEVGKLFSGTQGGGVHERELTRERFSTVKSRPQLAAALQATLETMQGGLDALEQRRDAILGPNSGADLIGEDTRAKIARVQAAIERLKGGSDGAQPAAAAAPDRTAVEAEMRRRGMLK